MLADIQLKNFRSYEDANFKFSPNVNIIVGPNASGKTNLLEAVLMVSKGKSYRAKDNELIRFNKEWSRLDANLSSGSARTVKLTNEKTFLIDDKEYKRLSLDKTLPVVLFEPNHLQLLTGRPDRRRDFLDDLIEQTINGYGGLRRHYGRALAQRNNLLKQPHLDRNHIFPWDVKLSQLAGQIVRERVNIVKEINNKLEALYKELSGDKTKANIKYLNKWSPEAYETNLLKTLEADIQLDKIKGFTSHGPHREDFIVNLNSRPSQLIASRGETRTILLALKIIELAVIEKARDIKPILLLDDVFSELDKNRRKYLINKLKSNQVFVTTTDADLITKDFSSLSKIILTN